MMNFIRPIAGGRFFACAAFAAAMIAPALTQPLEQFPFDQELLLETPPMRPGKRMPSLTVERNGNAVIDLWCKSVPAHVEFSDNGMKIETPALPDDLPQMQSNGQCTPPRMAADVALLEKFTQVTSWQREGNSVILAGPERLKFSAPAN
jgi:heat shock protein HslJ